MQSRKEGVPINFFYNFFVGFKGKSFLSSLPTFSYAVSSQYISVSLSLSLSHLILSHPNIFKAIRIRIRLMEYLGIRFRPNGIRYLGKVLTSIRIRERI